MLVLHEQGEENVIEDQLLQQKIASPIAKMAISPNAKFVACYRKDGVLTVMSTSFTTKVGYPAFEHHLHPLELMDFLINSRFWISMSSPSFGLWK